MYNPYDPQNPAKPDYFGGRKQVLKAVQDRIDRAKAQHQSGGILAYGHRGVGKTSLIKKIVDIATSPESGSENALIVYRRISKQTDAERLYQLLIEGLLEEIQGRQTKIQRLKAVAAKVSSIKLLEFGVDLKSVDNSSQSQYQRWRSLLRSLQNADFVLIALDDADYLTPDALGELKTIVEDSVDAPILLVVSGGISFERGLVDEYSPIARVFSGASTNLGEFTREETKEVLTKPLEGKANLWLEDGIDELQRLTFGYPYLVQCVASASYAGDRTLDASRVKEAISQAVSIGKSWLDHEIPNASDQDVLSFSRLINQGKHSFRSAEITNLGVRSVYIGRLVKLGVLKQISRGRYVLQKSPIVATYEHLKRGLGERTPK